MTGTEASVHVLVKGRHHGCMHTHLCSFHSLYCPGPQHKIRCHPTLGRVSLYSYQTKTIIYSYDYRLTWSRQSLFEIPFPNDSSCNKLKKKKPICYLPIHKLLKALTNSWNSLMNWYYMGRNRKSIWMNFFVFDTASLHTFGLLKLKEWSSFSFCGTELAEMNHCIQLFMFNHLPNLHELFYFLFIFKIISWLVYKYKVSIN